MNELQKFCRELQIDPVLRSRLEPVWEKLVSGWNGNLPFFLDNKYFEHIYPYCKSNFPLTQVMPFAESVIETARTNPQAALLAYIIFREEFQQDHPFRFGFPPDRLPIFGEKYSGMLGLMIALGAYPLIADAYAKLGIPESYAQAAMQSIGASMIAFGLAHGGIPGRPCQFGWIRRYIDTTLYRIGRLEYLLHPYVDWLPAIYRGPHGQLAVLCREGWKFRSEKRRAMPGENVVFTAHWEETEKSITGIPCHPDGKVDFEHPLTLKTAEWHPVASPWDICPSIHIPAGSRMPFEIMKESMIEARIFFDRYLYKRIPLLCCWSWILNPAWETLIQNSNMVRFRQECFAFPTLSVGPKSGMVFLFGRDDVSPEELPAINRVQKAYQEAFRQDQIDYGGVFVLMEDLEKLGNQYYRKKYTMFHTR